VSVINLIINLEQEKKHEQHTGRLEPCALNNYDGSISGRMPPVHGELTVNEGFTKLPHELAPGMAFINWRF